VRRLSGLVAVAALLAAGGLVHGDVLRGAQALLAPVYDVVSQTSLRNLAIALESYALMEGDLDEVTATELARWGWEPGATTDVTIWVAGEQFRAVVRDVRPGAAAFEVIRTSDAAGIAVHKVDVPAASADTPPEAGVTVFRSGL